MSKEPKRGKGLSAAFCRTVTTAGRYTDRDGLMLIVSATGSKRWGQRLVIHGKRCDLGLGGYPKLGLAEAREKAAENRQIARDPDSPGDPRTARREKAASPVFEEAARQAMEVKLAGLKNAKHQDQWRNTLTTYVFPVIGQTKPQDVTADDVVRVLQPIWESKTETATRVRARIEYILDFAAARGWRKGDNPARWKGCLKFHLPAPSAIQKKNNQPAIRLEEASAWFWEVGRRQGISARALEFLTLTAARSGEVRGATWNEIDLDRGVWTIPAARMKGSRPHRVPLSPEAVALLKGLPRIERSDLIFNAPRGRELSDGSILRVMRRIFESAASDDIQDLTFCDPVSGRPAVPHGLRSTFRQWAAERGFPRDMAEIALAHWIGSEVERSYQRSDMMERRREMMAEWANFLMEERRIKETALAGTSPFRSVG